MLRAVAQDERSQARNRDSRSTGSSPGWPRRSTWSAPEADEADAGVEGAAARGETRRSDDEAAAAGRRPMSDLAPERVGRCSAARSARPYLYAAESASTQDALRDAGHPQGAVAVAEHQTAGRGRSGRRGKTRPPGAALLGPPRAARRGLAAATLAGRRARSRRRSRSETAPAAQIKWPNDVLVDGGKVAGILLEASGRRVVCGIGINVNLEAGELPRETALPRHFAADRLGTVVRPRGTARGGARRARGPLQAVARGTVWRASGRISSDGTPSGCRVSHRRPPRHGRPDRGRRASHGSSTTASSLLVESGEVESRAPG